jgi:hypothetical protein
MDLVRKNVFRCLDKLYNIFSDEYAENEDEIDNKIVNYLAKHDIKLPEVYVSKYLEIKKSLDSKFSNKNDAMHVTYMYFD